MPRPCTDRSTPTRRWAPPCCWPCRLAPGSAAAAEEQAPVDPPTVQLQRIEVTGSAIRRVDAETAVPISVLRAEELRQQGVTSTEELIGRLSGNQGVYNSSRSVGSATGGASFADLRGIGANKTLVLLNGRRLANNAIDGSAVDLNTIPFAAIDRVEVLRDGASALYGTDAIGGVINFITRKSLNEGRFDSGYASPPTTAAATSATSALAGASASRRRIASMSSRWPTTTSRSASAPRTAATPTTTSRDAASTTGSGTAFPGNWSQGANASNPLAAGGCKGADLIPRNGICRQSLWRYLDLVPETEKTSVFSRATGKLADEHNVSLEYFWSRNDNATQVGPGTLTGLQIDPGTAFYPGNGITPGPGGFVLDPSRPVEVNWRQSVLGPRLQSSQNTGQRLLLGFDGQFAGWDYDIGASYNQNKVVDHIHSGYVDDRAAALGIANGTLNPFGPQTDAGLAYLGSHALSGDFRTSVGRVKGLDARASREIGDWFGAGPAALALGGEFRKEAFHQDIQDFAGNVQSLGVDPAATVSGERNLKAQYAELNVPVLDSLELSAAIRHDKYSDFGSTSNPKYSFRFQPFRQLVLRGAYSEGFRAPSLYELYNPTFTTYTSANYDDPRLCAGGQPSQGGIANRDCAQQFYNATGGNTDLRPETARNVTLGLVYQPLRDLSVGLDFWWIRIANQIAEFPEAAIFADPQAYAGRIVRKADGSIDHVVTGLANLGKVKTSGVDLSLDYRFPASRYGQFGLDLQGTYVSRYDFQQQIGGQYLDNVGDFQGVGVIARWKHVANATWSRDAWQATLSNRYTSGYNDYDRASHGKVGSWNLWDLAGSYRLSHALGLTLGVKNLFDREPPFSNQTYTFQSGYDPRYTDPYGRILFGRLSYSF